MKARTRILDGAFGPEDLALLGHVFDKTWQEIEDRFRDDEAARDIAREWLASIIVRLGQSHDLHANLTCFTKQLWKFSTAPSGQMA